MGIRLPGPGGAAAARNGFGCAVPGPDTGYPLQERLTGSRHTARATTAFFPPLIAFRVKKNCTRQFYIGRAMPSSAANDRLDSIPASPTQEMEAGPGGQPKWLPAQMDGLNQFVFAELSQRLLADLASPAGF